MTCIFLILSIDDSSVSDSCGAKEIAEKCYPVIRDALDFVESVTGHHPSNCCLFRDALDLIPNGTYDREWPYSKKLQAVKHVTPANRGHCVLHDGPCVQSPNVTFGVSGLPCPDMSSIGKRRKRAGGTSNVYLAHGRWATHNRIPLLLIECTPESRL